jgi:hypothetical protein
MLLCIDASRAGDETPRVADSAHGMPELNAGSGPKTAAAVPRDHGLS